jgi:hypothetical protein
LWVDTDISEEHAASIFQVEVCRFRNRLGYIGRLERRWSSDPKRGIKERNPVPSSGKKSVKSDP